MGSVELNNFEDAVALSALVLDATIKWDDVVEKLEDNPDWLTVLDISQEELDQTSRLMRKLMDNAHDRKSDLKTVLKQAMLPTPAPAMPEGPAEANVQASEDHEAASASGPGAWGYHFWA